MSGCFFKARLHFKFTLERALQVLTLIRNLKCVCKYFRIASEMRTMYLIKLLPPGENECNTF